MARVAAATATDSIRTALGEPELEVGIILCIQTHGSLLNWQPHVHALVTDGGFRPDGSFVHLPLHRTEVLTEAFRRARPLDDSSSQDKLGGVVIETPIRHAARRRALRAPREDDGRRAAVGRHAQLIGGPPHAGYNGPVARCSTHARWAKKEARQRCRS